VLAPPPAGAIRVDAKVKPQPTAATAPSRYGPNGTTLYPRTDPSSSYANGPASNAAGDAISRFIDGSADAAARRIDLGAYAEAGNAARVADLMRPYGDVTLARVRSAVGESLTVVTLRLTTGVAAGEVITLADRLGIHDAAILDR
jgi:hypothetical protein